MQIFFLLGHGLGLEVAWAGRGGSRARQKNPFIKQAGLGVDLRVGFRHKET